jgi:hypothetical protein
MSASCWFLSSETITDNQAFVPGLMVPEFWCGSGSFSFGLVCFLEVIVNFLRPVFGLRLHDRNTMNFGWRARGKLLGRVINLLISLAACGYLVYYWHRILDTLTANHAAWFLPFHDTGIAVHISNRHGAQDKCQFVAQERDGDRRLVNLICTVRLNSTRNIGRDFNVDRLLR